VDTGNTLSIGTKVANASCISAKAPRLVPI
jgi:hypothetical protein